jgi:lauroyl/myristoyl acyltransferase
MRSDMMAANANCGKCSKKHTEAEWLPAMAVILCNSAAPEPGLDISQHHTLPMPSQPLSRTDTHVRRDSVELVSQSVSDEKPRAISHLDINILLSLLTLTPLSLYLDERHWASLCRFWSSFTLVGRLGRRRRRQVERGLQIAYSTDDRMFDAVCHDLEAHHLELRLQILREQLCHDWKPEITTRGVSHLEAALGAGRGAILWVSRFAFADIVTKCALHRIGRPLVHLSAAMHGFSTTSFGRRWLNPMQQQAENHYLAERVVLDSQSPAAVMRRLQNVLRRNGIVSISVYSRGAYVVDAPFMAGRWRIATGAPSLAWKTGAQLLPVFAVRNSRNGSFVVTIDEPLPINQAGSKEEAQKHAVVSYLTRLEPYVVANPGQWLGWPTVRAAKAMAHAPAD